MTRAEREVGEVETAGISAAAAGLGVPREVPAIREAVDVVPRGRAGERGIQGVRLAGVNVANGSNPPPWKLPFCLMTKT